MIHSFASLLSLLWERSVMSELWELFSLAVPTSLRFDDGPFSHLRNSPDQMSMLRYIELSKTETGRYDKLPRTYSAPRVPGDHGHEVISLRGYSRATWG